jgi:membrane-associated phospholipid phosphatase
VTPRWLVLLGALLLAVLVAVGMQVPAPPSPPPGPVEALVIAHGGAQAHAPGNTIEAFDLALEQGADVLEMDVQLTADDQLVVTHDATVDRMTEGTGTIRGMTVEQVQALDAGHGFVDADGEHPWRGRGVRVPTNMPEGETTGFYVRHLAGLHPWWTPPGDLFQVPEHHEGRHVVTPRFVDAAERLGVEVQVWTVNEPDQMHRLLDAGVHGIMTDVPDVLVEVLADRAAADDPARYTDQLQRARDLHEGPGWLLALLHAVTFLGDEEFYLLVFPILYWSVSRRVGVRLGAMLLLTSGINAIGKLLVASPRPPFLDPSLERVPETTFGIPSGHAQNAVAVWGLLAATLRRWWAVVGAVLLTAAIGWSRVHLGAHFLEDVLVGWGVGAVLLVLFLLLQGRVAAWWLRLSPAAQVLAGVVASLALIAPGVVLSARLQGQQFPWPGLVDPAATTGASAVVTPAATLAGLVAGLVLLRIRGGFDSGGALHLRFARVAVGLVGVIALWQGLGSLFPGGEDVVALVLRYLRYGLVGLWVGGVAPVLFVRLGLAPRPAA